MGYACPVCDEPQQDAEHLANHLAFQAMTHGGDHEAWLDEHAPDWASGGPADLAPQVATHAAEAEYDVVFEDTTPEERTEQFDPDLQGALDEQGHGHEHEHGHEHDHGGGGIDLQSADLDADARDIVAEAQELTREMLADERDESEGTDEDEIESESDDRGE